MKNLMIVLIALFVVSCANSGGSLPTAGTITTGDTVKTPKQYEEFCERDEHDVCPEEE